MRERQKKKQRRGGSEGGRGRKRERGGEERINVRGKKGGIRESTSYKQAIKKSLPLSLMEACILQSASDHTPPLYCGLPRLNFDPEATPP